MRDRSEIEDDALLAHPMGGGSKLTTADLTLEVLLDIREQLQLNHDAAAQAHAQLLQTLRVLRG